MPPAELAAVVRYIGGHRADGAAPLAVALEGRTDGTAAVVRPGKSGGFRTWDAP
jgi:hypothetical protein